MRKEIVYIAEDGKKFANEQDCQKYEQMMRTNHNTSVLQTIKELDQKMWKKYHPDYNEKNEPSLNVAPIWLKTDVISILMDFPESEDDVMSMIKEAKYADEIFKKYLDMAEVKRQIAVRNDFKAAFKSVKHGWELSSDLDYSMSKKDLSNLAKLHKAGKCRRKIEELLTDCNFHSAYGAFCKQDYDEFLLED